MTDKKTMRVKFLSDDVTQNATFSILTSTNGSYYGKLDFTSGVIRYLDSRFLDIELVTNAATGLKVPVTSVVSKKFYTIPVEYGTQGGDSNSVGFLRYKRAEDGSLKLGAVNSLQNENAIITRILWKVCTVLIRDMLSSDESILLTRMSSTVSLRAVRLTA